mgnify:FL=1
MSIFQFKQFNINQDKTAMKVGTDGVLLGAWAPIASPIYSILDIGAGTGLIALMLAQRCNAEQIDAIEIDDNAYLQCVENFEQSPWTERLFCYHAGLDELIEDPEDEYDLIVCNPPFYSEDYKTPDESRNTARFQDSLPFVELVEAADLLLSENGILAVIIPFKEEENFIKIAQQFELYPQKITRVKGTLEAEIKRSLMSFSRDENSTRAIDELIIEISRHNYTQDYTELTKEFYLKM